MHNDKLFSEEIKVFARTAEGNASGILGKLTTLLHGVKVGKQKWKMDRFFALPAIQKRVTINYNLQ